MEYVLDGWLWQSQQSLANVRSSVRSEAAQYAKQDTGRKASIKVARLT